MPRDPNDPLDPWGLRAGIKDALSQPFFLSIPILIIIMIATNMYFVVEMRGLLRDMREQRDLYIRQNERDRNEIRERLLKIEAELRH